MMFPAYQDYKDSGVEWLGKVPTDWSIVPIKHATSIVGGTTPKSDADAYWDGEFVWITPADLSKLNSKEIFDSQRKISQLGFDSCGLTLVPPKSIVLSTRAPIGSLGIAGVELATNQGCKSLIPKSNIDSKFLFYVLSISTEALNVRGRGTTFLELSADELGVFRVPVPNLEAQRSIANFLDHETSKIDELIREQQQLIELLNEKRQSIISNAVCRGLDPNVPMKDSGVAWLGMVPEHWAVRKIKNVCKLTTGITPPTENQENYSEDGFPWIRPEDLNEINAPTVATKFLSDSGRTYIREVRSGSTLICCIGTIGKVGLLNKQSSTNQQITAASFVGNDRYFYYLMQAARTELDVSSTGNVLKILNTERLGNIKIPIPNDVEQEGISKFLDYEISKLDSLMSESNSAVGILNERKSALISAAVCGQIDVRNFHGN